jgi:hypothetical protein
MKAFADNVAIRVPAFKVICTAAKSHGQAYSQTPFPSSFTKTYATFHHAHILAHISDLLVSK